MPTAITHDLDTLYAICDRVAVLADKKVIAVGTLEEIGELDHPWAKEYFHGPRARAAQAGRDRATDSRRNGEDDKGEDKPEPDTPAKAAATQSDVPSRWQPQEP